MNSAIGQLNSLIRNIKCVREYQGEAPEHNSSHIDHIATGIIFALISIICGLLYAPLYWLYLATWIYHCVFIELILDTFIMKKNYKTWDFNFKKQQEQLSNSIIKNIFHIDWPKVFAQLVERSVGHVICLPLLICLQ